MTGQPSSVEYMIESIALGLQLRIVRQEKLATSFCDFPSIDVTLIQNLRQIHKCHHPRKRMIQ